MAYIIPGFLFVLVGAVGFFCVWSCGFLSLALFWGIFLGVGLFIWAFCLFALGEVGFLGGWLGFFVCLFGFFYFTFAATFWAFLLFRDELITSYWWGVVHCDLQFFTMTYKSSLAEPQRSPVPPEILLLVLKWKATCSHCDHRRFQGTFVNSSSVSLTSISPSCFEPWIAEL